MSLQHRIQQFLSSTTSKSPMVSIKAEKELYKDILAATSYLEKATTPQRIHHINGSHYVAVCSICMAPVEWYNGEYRITCCRSCSMKQQNIDYLNTYNAEHNTSYVNVSQIPSVKMKKENSSLEKYGTENVSQSQTVKDLIGTKAKRRFADMTKDEKLTFADKVRNSGCVETAKSTYKKKTGYDNVLLNPEVQRKIKKTLSSRTSEEKLKSIHKSLETREENGHININTPEKEKYYQDVWRYSNFYYNENKGIIDPDSKRNINGGCRLDHIYSIFQGYRDGIPPEVLGHYSNLQVIPEEVNRAKSTSCGKSKEELFEDFKNNKFNEPNYGGD